MTGSFELASPRPDRKQRRDAAELVGVGALAGLAWAAGLRGWMSQIAGSESRFTWLGTEGLVLLPGLLVGGLLGWAELQRRTGCPRQSRWIALSPVLFAGALLDPAVFRALMTTGEGGGSLAVVVVALSGGVALARRFVTWARFLGGAVAVTLIVWMGLISSKAAPLTTAHGLWVSLWVVSLLCLVACAASIPHRCSRV